MDGDRVLDRIPPRTTAPIRKCTTFIHLINDLLVKRLRTGGEMLVLENDTSYHESASASAALILLVHLVAII